MSCRYQANYFKLVSRVTITDSQSHKIASRTDTRLGCLNPAGSMLWQIIKNHIFLCTCSFAAWLCCFSHQEVTFLSSPLEYGLILCHVLIDRMVKFTSMTKACSMWQVLPKSRSSWIHEKKNLFICSVTLRCHFLCYPALPSPLASKWGLVISSHCWKCTGGSLLGEASKFKR